jgi:hypothetical protein
MIKKELVFYLTAERNQILYSYCSDRKDYNTLIQQVQKITFKLEAALLASPDEYVSLNEHIGNFKNDIRDEGEEKEAKHLCKQLRRRVLYTLRNVIFDNSQYGKSEMQLQAEILPNFPLDRP